MSPSSQAVRFTLPRQPQCEQCVRLIEEVKRLRQENQGLKARLRYQQRKIDEGYFGASTPSSQKPFKPTSKAAPNNGGARKGHPGHGRQSVAEDQADEVICLDPEQVCPDCKVNLDPLDTRSRTVVELEPVRVKKVVYKVSRRRCPECRRVFRANPPGVLPRFQYSTAFLAYIATEHYLYGTTMGRLAKRLDLSEGSLFSGMHHLAQLLEGGVEKLIAEYRQAPVHHADETSWRNDGHNGYAWIFCTPTLSLFRLRNTRSAKVVKEVMGTDPLPGTLVVDRYPVYNKAPCELQYCYSHLSRDVEELSKQFPHKQEVKNFVEATIPLLSQAIKLRALPISDEAFYEQANELKSEIEHVMQKDAQHAAIQNIQTIFRENPSRLYRWAEDRAVPADNNRAERDLRGLVIARKISFGSQSDAGAKTREILMSILVTLSKRDPANVMTTFKECLDQLAADPTKDPYSLLFEPPDTS